MAKILLVEDDIALSEIYQVSLSAEGHEIYLAGDGEKAESLAVQIRPDLILLDIMMPKINGLYVLEFLRSVPGLEQSKIIVMTALGGNEYKNEASKYNISGYLVKSQVTVDDMIALVNRVLAEPSLKQG